MRTASTAGTAGRPQLPRVAAPLVHVDGALQVLVGVTGSSTTSTGVPVVGVDLPESHIPQVRRALTSVVADGVGVSTGLVAHNALAVGLVPGVLRAPRGDIQDLLGGTARARRAVATRAVATAGGAGGVDTGILTHQGAGHGGVHHHRGQQRKQDQVVHRSDMGIEVGKGAMECDLP